MTSAGRVRPLRYANPHPPAVIKQLPTHPVVIKQLPTHPVVIKQLITDPVVIKQLTTTAGRQKANGGLG